jgi:hypothetical protein
MNEPEPESDTSLKYQDPLHILLEYIAEVSVILVKSLRLGIPL